jgi:UDP-N-acetylglucosamine 2-epimerase (non-hydrolysing)
MLIVYVVGARPNVVKMAPVVAELRRRMPADRHVVVHTGQHYDRMMSEVFLEELEFGEPDHHLNVGSASHAVQTARVMERLEPLLVQEAPDLVIVPGDVNSTLAAALVAVKLGIPVAHVESGLRSFDRSMPEEVNRIVTDQFSQHLFIHSEEAIDNLRREGIGDERVHFVGNTMIDALMAFEPRFRSRDAASRLGLVPGEFLLVTLHRPSLVDGPLLEDAIAALEQVSQDLPVFFPVHPRTRKMLGDRPPGSNLQLADPVGYLDFLSLTSDAAAVLTDSGGVQEETTFLDIPCFTLRDTTERPVTVRLGTNTVLGLAPERITQIPAALAGAARSQRELPPMWDGRASARIADVITGEG